MSPPIASEYRFGGSSQPANMLKEVTPRIFFNSEDHSDEDKTFKKPSTPNKRNSIEVFEDGKWKRKNVVPKENLGDYAGCFSQPALVSI